MDFYVVWTMTEFQTRRFLILDYSVKEHLDGQPHWFRLHALQDIIIPGYRQPGTRSVAPPVTQADSVKSIKVSHFPYSTWLV